MVNLFQDKTWQYVPFQSWRKIFNDWRWLILVPGLGNNQECKVLIDDPIKIIKPDKSVIETTIVGIALNKFQDILIDNALTKDDVPIGSEIWLNKE